MTVLEKWIKKTKIAWLAKALLILFAIVCFVFMIGFFVLPFLKYSENTKLAFLCCWICAAVVLFLICFIACRDALKNNEKEIVEYKKDKVLYIFTRIGMGAYLFGIFLLIFLVRNNFLSLSTFATIGISVLGLFVFSTTIGLLAQYKDNYKKLAKDAFRFVQMSCLIVVSSLLLFGGVIMYEKELIPQQYSRFCVGVGAIILLSYGIYWVSQMFFSDKKVKEKNLYSSIFLFLGIVKKRR